EMAKALGEVFGETDGHRAGDDHEPLPVAEPFRHVDEMVEGFHAVLARWREVREAEDQRVGRVEVFDSRRAAKRSRSELRDVVPDRSQSGALPQGKLLRADGAEADDSD